MKSELAKIHFHVFMLLTVTSIQLTCIIILHPHPISVPGQYLYTTHKERKSRQDNVWKESLRSTCRYG